MNPSEAHNRRIAEMVFASIYPHYVAKVEKKGRTKEELTEVLTWLTGYSGEDILSHIESKSTFAAFFGDASLNPNAVLVTGKICGYRIEDLENELTRNVRVLDKLVDELAKGRPMAKILRQPKAKANTDTTNKKRKSKSTSSGSSKKRRGSK